MLIRFRDMNKKEAITKESFCNPFFVTSHLVK